MQSLQGTRVVSGGQTVEKKTPPCQRTPNRSKSPPGRRRTLNAMCR